MRQLRTEVHAYMNSLNYDVNGLLEFKNKTATTVKVKFDKWLREELRSDEFKSVIGKNFPAGTNLYANIPFLDEHIDKGKEKSSIFNSLTSSFGDLTSSRGDLSTDVVDLITTKIEGLTTGLLRLVTLPVIGMRDTFHRARDKINFSYSRILNIGT